MELPFAEAWKIKMVEPIKKSTREEREKWLAVIIYYHTKTMLQPTNRLHTMPARHGIHLLHTIYLHIVYRN